jgi:plastocyanin
MILLYNVNALTKLQKSLLPSGLEQQYPGSGNTFTIKFENPGTNGYLCLLHPWMTGSVIVK